RLLADHRTLRLVVLNSCEGARGNMSDLFSSTASVLMGRSIPAVLAMQYEITDEAAITLARTFYTALAKGMPIDMAVSESRKTMSFLGGGSVQWGTPVLYMRSSNGVLFYVKSETDVPSAKKEQWLDLGDKDFNAGHYAEALAAYEQAIRLDSNFIMAY